jgi:hypothetical protein
VVNVKKKIQGNIVSLIDKGRGKRARPISASVSERARDCPGFGSGHNLLPVTAAL